MLFGNILALDGDALSLLASISSVSVIVMAIIYRPLIIECVDSSFLRDRVMRVQSHIMVFYF